MLLALVFAGVATPWPVVAQLAPPSGASSHQGIDRAGLALVLRSAGNGATDARAARLAALYVPEAAAPGPFLDPGPFEATFRGAIELDLNDSYRFSIRGSGTVRLLIGGEVVIERQELPTGDAPLSTDGEVRLNKGLNPIELVYRSPAAGDASLRLTWGNDYLPEEPLPPGLLRHADSPALDRGRSRRAARELMADVMCVRCHALSSAPEAPARPRPRSGPGSEASEDAASGSPGGRRGVDGMPELQATGPDLDGIGARLRPRWIEQWLLDPKALRPQARMPRVLSTDGAEARQQAADLAAFLIAGAGDGASAEPERAPSGEASDGRRLYDETGCAACHGDATSAPALDTAPRLVASPAFEAPPPASDPLDAPPSPPPSDPLGAPASPPASGSDSAEDQTRLLRLGDKWQPSALAAYLLDPNRFDPWSRMPRTELETDEAASVAAYLFAATSEGVEAPLGRRDPPGDPRRGRQLAEQLRCRSCHSWSGGDPPQPATPLDGLAGRPSTWTAGGDAADPHPRYDLDPAKVEAIDRFLTADVTSLARTVPAEFAERRIRSAGCLACHGRDGTPAAWSPPSPTSPRSGSTLPSSADENAQDYFATSVDGATGPDLLPPDLTWAGEKLRGDWLADFLAGRAGDRPRPHLQVRMPAFPAHADLLATGLRHQHGLPASPVDVRAIDPELAAIGRDLVRGDRLGCHSCHALGEDPALGGEGSEETINFDLVRRRLRRGYFDRFLRDPQRILPGSKMPQFVDEDGYTALYDVFDGEASRQFEAIWHYLGTLE